MRARRPPTSWCRAASSVTRERGARRDRREHKELIPLCGLCVPPSLNTRTMRHLLLAAFVVTAASVPGAQAKQTFTGTITDNGCADANHSHMRMGSNDAECTLACVDAHGATYVLYDGKTTYALSDQKTPE